MMRVALRALVLVVVLSPAVQAQDAAAALGDTIAKYQALPLLAYTGTVFTKTEGNPAETRQVFEVQFAGPDRVRLTFDPGRPLARVVQRTGDRAMDYRAILGEYREVAAGDLQLPTPGTITPLLVLGAEAVIDGVWPLPEGAEVSMRAERFHGRLVRAFTVTAEPHTTTLRVDPRSGLIVHLERRQMVPPRGEGDPVARVIHESYDYQPLDWQSVVALAPPAGATRVEQFSRPSPVNLAGQPAPSFTLLDTEGRQLDLTAFRGQVVMLNFWAPW